MIKVYESETHKYVCELWEASTKHPDSVFYYEDEYENEKNHYVKSPYIEDKYQVYQWLLWCASQLTFPFYAFELAEYAKKHWFNWFDNDKKESEE